ncbi:hypothetical protein [Burkholderia anthina]|uniref:hypothetical protein n=1 Tax=Burkholderia anthina TaxID=179879 RepID=UPI00158EF993|nr:hypothetical protein [Burkholderia anthina]
MKNWLICALACSLALLGGCATAPAPVTVATPVEAKVPVPVPCIQEVPQPPAPFLSDADLLEGSGAQVADKLWADHIARRDYIASLTGVLLACVALPATAAVGVSLSATPFR